MKEVIENVGCGKQLSCGCNCEICRPEAIGFSVSINLRGYESYNMPDKPGLFFLSYGENGHNYEPVAVIQGEESLMACNLYADVVPLDIFHNNLIAPKWAVSI